MTKATDLSHTEVADLLKRLFVCAYEAPDSPLADIVKAAKGEAIEVGDSLYKAIYQAADAGRRFADLQAYLKQFPPESPVSQNLPCDSTAEEAKYNAKPIKNRDSLPPSIAVLLGL